eukprot:gene11715-biopygen1852
MQSLVCARPWVHLPGIVQPQYCCLVLLLPQGWVPRELRCHALGCLHAGSSREPRRARPPAHRRPAGRAYGVPAPTAAAAAAAAAPGGDAAGAALAGREGAQGHDSGGSPSTRQNGNGTQRENTRGGQAAEGKTNHTGRKRGGGAWLECPLYSEK